MRPIIARVVIIVLTAGAAAPGAAQEPEPSDAPPPPPIREPLPPKVQDPEERIEPQVVIRREDDRIVEEYSVAGRVYMVRVTPDAGPPYYLVDTTGDGAFDTRRDHMQKVVPARWKIVEW